MKLIAETGRYEDVNGRQYIKSEFDPQNPVFIEVTGSRWSAKWRGNIHWIDWSVVASKMSEDIVEAIKSHTEEHLARSAPTFLMVMKQCLTHLMKHWNVSWKDFSDPTLLEWRVIWSLLVNPQRRGRLRGLYSDLANKGLIGACPFVATEMGTWKAAEERTSLRDVMNWHVTRGAMTSAEQELFRRALQQSLEEEETQQHISRVAAWIIYETLKRPAQLCEMRADSLVKIIPERGELEYFLRIPKVKAQTGREPELWPITTDLAREIESLSHRQDIKVLQIKYDRLLVTPKGMVHGQISSTQLSSRISRWLNTLDIKSPRTGQKLHVTCYRIRHTGATRMAAYGVSLDEIQYILEHDHPDSCKAYIDAIGSDLCPAIELAGRNLGDIFSQLNNLFFRGLLSSEIPVKPIRIPIVAIQPAVVGSCGLNGRCDRHPFYTCYDGCRYFLAWREADHRRALTFIEAQLAKWDAAEGNNERSKAMKDFDRVHRAISEVIRRIDLENNDERASPEAMA